MPHGLSLCLFVSQAAGVIAFVNSQIPLTCDNKTALVCAQLPGQETPTTTTTTIMTTASTTYTVNCVLLFSTDDKEMLLFFK